MPVYLLGEDIAFPPAELANRDGVVAVGGDFRPERLLLAYRSGIFPWPVEGMPLLWFSPDPRFVLDLREVHVGRSLRKEMRRSPYRITFDQAFDEVLAGCADTPRPGQTGTWITDELFEGYSRMHRLGYAHSVEAWQGDRLVGGLYGIALGRAFFGESMFAHAPDASKIAFATLCGNLRARDFLFVDCQVHTEHLERFGAKEIPRKRFLRWLLEALEAPTKPGAWEMGLPPSEALDALE
ncbi:MAG: leucyl/phenylalanyl-tRNA--protein transferase [Polyangiales bacterium]